MVLEEKELLEIKGGGIKLIACLSAIGIFIAGVVDGFIRPLKCN